MIPSKTWFPSSLQDRAAWFKNFTEQFTTLAVSLGFAPAAITALAADNEAFQALAGSALAIDAYGKGMTAYRKLITEGKNGDPPATLPIPPDLSIFSTAFPGIFERMDDLVQQIRAAPGYSKEEGEQLGIVPKQAPSKNSLDNEKPVIKGKAMPGNAIEISFVRGVATGIKVEAKVDDETDWKAVGKYLQSPADLDISLNGGVPHAVQLRARFIVGDKPVGFVSDVLTVVTTP